MSFFSCMQQPLTPVVGAWALFNEVLIDELFQDSAKALFCDPKNVEEVGDHDPRIAVNEMQHPVVGAPELILCESIIRIGGEVAISEKKQFDQIVRQAVFRSCFIWM